jgi:polar amino acid transport system permease protein
MIELSLIDMATFLLLATRWTIGLSAIAFVGSGVGALLMLLLRYASPHGGRTFMGYYVELLQGTPPLLQVFLIYYGLPQLGVEVSPLMAATIALTLYGTAYLSEIWRGCVDAIPLGQWDASASLGMTFMQQMRDVILPQALKIAIPPTVGFLVQLIKNTAITSIVGFHELTKAGTVINNATFQPFITYSMVALIYFAICYPLTHWSRRLERRLTPTGR